MYSIALLQAGFDDLDTLASIEDADLREVGLPPHHAALLRRKLQELQQRAVAQEEPGDDHPVAAFLCEAGLAQFARVLLAAGFDEMETLMLIDDQDLKDLGIPRGYAVKLHRALREDQGRRSSAVAPAAFARAAASFSAGFSFPGMRAAEQMVREHVPADCMPTEEEASYVVASWKIIEGVGVAIVAGVLIKHACALAPETFSIVSPAVRARYQEWTDEGDDEGQELWHSKGLRRIFSKILNAVGCSVAGLHDMSKLVPILVKLGGRHYHYGVREHNLQVVGQALDMTLRDLLGENYTFDVRAAWCTVYACISSFMVEGFRLEVREMEESMGISHEAEDADGCAHQGLHILKEVDSDWSSDEGESTYGDESERERTDAETTEVGSEGQMPMTPEASTKGKCEVPAEVQAEEWPGAPAKE